MLRGDQVEAVNMTEVAAMTPLLDGFYNGSIR